MTDKPRQITATDLIFMKAERLGKPITREQLENSDIMFDQMREEKLLPDNQFKPPFWKCKHGCRDKGYDSCHCH